MYPRSGVWPPPAKSVLSMAFGHRDFVARMSSPISPKVRLADHHVLSARVSGNHAVRRHPTSAPNGGARETLSITEAAALLGVAPPSLRRYISNGDLGGIGSPLRLRRRELNASSSAAESSRPTHAPDPKRPQAAVDRDLLLPREGSPTDDTSVARRRPIAAAARWRGRLSCHICH
jgi:hypothetical protein